MSLTHYEHTGLSPVLHGFLASFTPWSAEELEILRTVYAIDGIAAARKVLLGRSDHAIYAAANKLGIRRCRRWTRADDCQLNALWGTGPSLQEIADTCKRSVAATYARAEFLGLPIGAPNGWEYLHPAARRMGMQTSRLRRILAEYGVALHTSLSKPRGNAKTYWIVRIDDAEAAVRAWRAQSKARFGRIREAGAA